MGLLANLKMLWQNRAAIGALENAVVEIKNDAIKDGWKTSEFWGKTIIQVLSVASLFVPALKVDPDLVLKIVAGIESAYALYRTVHKMNPPTTVTVIPANLPTPASNPPPTPIN